MHEPALPGLPAGPGYYLVLDHELVSAVLRNRDLLVGRRRHPDPRPGLCADLRYVQRMMLNMDPPEHSRLRRMVAQSFTPRAVAALESRIAAHARHIVDRMLAGPAEVDFAKDVAADLPLLALADVLGVPAEDRWLMFDWSNRVIGFLDPDYAVSTSLRRNGGHRPRPARPYALRPSPGPDGRMPDPRSRAGMPDLYRYAHLLGAAKRADPGADVMSDPARAARRVRRPDVVEEFENMFWLFAVAGNETLRNGIPGGMIALLAHPARAAAAALGPVAVACRRGRDVAVVDAGDDLPPHRGPGLPRSARADRGGRQGGGVVHRRQSRPVGLRAS